MSSTRSIYLRYHADFEIQNGPFVLNQAQLLSSTYQFKWHYLRVKWSKNSKMVTDWDTKFDFIFLKS